MHHVFGKLDRDLQCSPSIRLDTRLDQRTGHAPLKDSTQAGVNDVRSTQDGPDKLHERVHCKGGPGLFNPSKQELPSMWSVPPGRPALCWTD